MKQSELTKQLEKDIIAIDKTIKAIFESGLEVDIKRGYGIFNPPKDRPFPRVVVKVFKRQTDIFFDNDIEPLRGSIQDDISKNKCVF